MAQDSRAETIGEGVSAGKHVFSQQAWTQRRAWARGCFHLPVPIKSVCFWSRNNLKVENQDSNYAKTKSGRLKNELSESKWHRAMAEMSF